MVSDINTEEKTDMMKIIRVLRITGPQANAYLYYHLSSPMILRDRVAYSPRIQRLFNQILKPP